MRGLLTACVLLLNAFTPALAQDATFDVIMAGHTIGSVRVLERVYYQEPTRVQAVYSEKFGAMCRVTRREEGTYYVDLPNGKQSIYNYRNGQCVRVVTELGGVRLSIVRQQR